VNKNTIESLVVIIENIEKNIPVFYKGVEMTALLIDTCGDGGINFTHCAFQITKSFNSIEQGKVKQLLIISNDEYFHVVEPIGIVTNDLLNFLTMLPGEFRLVHTRTHEDDFKLFNVLTHLGMDTDKAKTVYNSIYGGMA
jgi:hypothetical protein